MSRVIVPDTTVIVRATQPAVDLEYIRRHVRALMHSDDVTLQTFLDAATTYFEEKTSTKVMYQTLETRFDACPASSGIIELPYAPLQDIVSVQYLDSGGDLQTLEDAGTSPATPLYGVWAPQDVPAKRGYIEPLAGASWPATASRRNAVRVQYVAGYAETTADVPAIIVGALCYLIGHYDYFRMPASERELYTVPFGMEDILKTFKYAALPRVQMLADDPSVTGAP